VLGRTGAVSALTARAADNGTVDREAGGVDREYHKAVVTRLGGQVVEQLAGTRLDVVTLRVARARRGRAFAIRGEPGYRGLPSPGGTQRGRAAGWCLFGERGTLLLG